MKRILKTTSLAAALALAGLTSAFAADLVEADPVPPTPTPVYDDFSWAGFYVGGQIGYGSVDSSLSVPGARLGGDLDGVVAGGFVGYNYQIDNFVIGIEGDINYVDFERDDTFGAFTSNARFDYIGTIGPRLGYAIDRALVYVEGGYAFAEYGFDLSDGLNRFDDDTTISGYYLGVGMDYAFTDNIFAGVEYNFADFEGDDFIFNNSSVDVGNLETHIIKARVGFKF